MKMRDPLEVQTSEPENRKLNPGNTAPVSRWVDRALTYMAEDNKILWQRTWLSRDLRKFARDILSDAEFAILGDIHLHRRKGETWRSG
ncbi:MAG: hypothetical protein AAF799_38955 [Myxococcota bacterium]